MDRLPLTTTEDQLRTYAAANGIDVDALAEDAGRHFAADRPEPATWSDAEWEAFMEDA